MPALRQRAMPAPSRTWKCFVSTPWSSIAITPSVRTPSTSTTSSSIGAQPRGKVAGSGQLACRSLLELGRDQADQVGHVDQADEPAAPIDDRQLADLPRLQRSTASATVAPTRTWTGSGVMTSPIGRSSIGLAALLEQAGQVAVGEDPEQPLGPRPRSGPPPTAAAARPSRTKTSRTVSSARAPADLPAGPHHVLDPGELAAEAPGRVVEGEVLGPEVAHPADQQGQGVADGHQRGRAGRRGQAERARLLDRPERDAEVGRLAERAGRPAR